jgi:hypothetical protein
MEMHRYYKKKSRDRRAASGKVSDSEGADTEDKGEIDNFQDLQLGSLSPVVRLEDKFPYRFSNLSTLQQDMDRNFEL